MNDDSPPDAPVRRPLRSYVLRAGRMGSGQQRALVELGPRYVLPGIDIDAAYRVIGEDGNANPRVFDIAFPHTSGLRPYSYGLQACNHTAGIVVEAWREEFKRGQSPTSNSAQLTKLHDKVANE